MKRQPEYDLQVAVVEYLKWQYPKLLFRSDIGSQIKLTAPQAARNKRIQSSFKCPDMVIYAARRGFHSMFLELKAESPWKKNGELYKDEHLEAQWRDILKLRTDGFHADFYWNYNEIEKQIDWYLK